MSLNPSKILSYPAGKKEVIDVLRLKACAFRPSTKSIISVTQKYINLSKEEYFKVVTRW